MFDFGIIFSLSLSSWDTIFDCNYFLFQSFNKQRTFAYLNFEMAQKKRIHSYVTGGKRKKHTLSQVFFSRLLLFFILSLMILMLISRCYWTYLSITTTSIVEKSTTCTGITVYWARKRTKVFIVMRHVAWQSKLIFESSQEIENKRRQRTRAIERKAMEKKWSHFVSIIL